MKPSIWFRSSSQLSPYLFSIIVVAGASALGCNRTSPADSNPRPAELQIIADRDGPWLEHPTSGFRFRHPGPAFKLTSKPKGAVQRSGEQVYTLINDKDKIVLLVKVSKTTATDDQAALRAFLADIRAVQAAASSERSGQRNRIDLDDIADGPHAGLRAWGYFGGAPMALRALVVHPPGSTERYTVGLMAISLFPEELASILESLRPSSSAAPPSLSLEQLRQRYPQLRRMRTPPRPLPPDPPPPAPPPGIELVHYAGPAGKLTAYLHTPKDRKRRYPAVLWCHGGFGGIGDSQWRFAKRAQGEVGPLFADSGFIVLSPAWRGEAGSDGEPEIYWGEVDDALASIDYLAKLDFVDPERIYVAGHSSGATIATFVGQRTKRVRAVFAFGASLHAGSLEEDDGWSLTFPFDETNVAAAWFRSPLAGLAETKVPTFYFEGSKNVWGPERAAEGVADRSRVPFHAFVLPDRDHWTAVPPMARLAIAKAAALQPGAPLEITQAEVAAALAAENSTAPTSSP